MAEHTNFLQIGEFSCLHCDFKCDGNDHVKVTAHTRTHLENLFGETLQDHDKRIRSEVLAACAKVAKDFCDEAEPGNSISVKYLEDKYGTLDAEKAILKLQPAAAALEALLEQAHEAALPHAADQLLKALTEGGEFAVDSPLAKVKKRVEELLREERLDEARWWEHLSQESHEQHPPYENCMYCARIAELEKARADRSWKKTEELK